AVVITDRFLEGRGFGSHAKIVHLTIANPVSAEDLDVILPPSFSKFERVHVDKEAHQVSVTAQVRLKPTAVAGLLEALRANEKVRKFEIECRLPRLEEITVRLGHQVILLDLEVPAQGVVLLLALRPH